MKCQVNNQLNARSSPTQTWIALGKLVAIPTTSQLHLCCTTKSLLRIILDPASWWLSQSCDSYAAAFCCRDVGPNGPNNKHGLKEHLWHVASTTSTLASSRVARLGWLPSQAKLPLHDGWHRTPTDVPVAVTCSNQQSEKQSFPNTNLSMALGKAGRYLQLRSFTFVSTT